MATLTITLPEGIQITDGRQITFRAPCDCTGVTGLVIEGITYSLVDTMDNSVSSGGVFREGSLVSVLLDTENSKAYILTTTVGASKLSNPFNLTIGNAVMSVDGSEDVSFSLEEVGAFPSAKVIYSETEPTVVNGAIWLKPI